MLRCLGLCQHGGKSPYPSLCSPFLPVKSTVLCCMRFLMAPPKSFPARHLLFVYCVCILTCLLALLVCLPTALHPPAGWVQQAPVFPQQGPHRGVQERAGHKQD